MDDDVLVWPSADHAAGSTTSHQHEALRAWVAARGDRRAKRQIVITDQTRHYRAAAKALAGASERAIELGSSYGDCLKVLHARCGGAARGVDISTTAVADAARRFPCLADSMEVMDCIHETERFAALTYGATLAFVDIGGDRHGDTVVRLIASDALQDVPVVVVKSQMLHRAAAAVTAAASVGPNAAVPTMDVLKPSRSSTSPPAIDGVAAWWRAVCESSLAFDAQAVAALGLGVPKWVASPDKWGRRADAVASMAASERAQSS